MTSIRGGASYTVPKIDVLVSGQFRNLNPANTAPAGATSATNGSSLNAKYPRAEYRRARHARAAAGDALATRNTTVNLLANGQMYPPERVTQLDMRFAKILRFGPRRADIGVDLYNLFNTNDTTAYDQNYDYGVANGARVAAADHHRAAAVRAVQRDVQFLVVGGCG